MGTKELARAAKLAESAGQTEVAENESDKKKGNNAEHTHYNEKLLVVQGKKYTVAEVCERYGFKYTSVKYHMKKGKTGDEIVATLRRNALRRRYSSTPGKGKRVTINNVHYQSVVEACDAHGIPVHQVYMLVKDNNISHEAALKQLVGRLPGHTVPCTIAGVTYPSREAAANAYSIPMQTIRARMRRQGLSFEAAILNGSKERLLMTAEYCKWKGLALEPIEFPESDNSLLYLVASVLTSNKYPVKCFRHQEKNIWAVRFKESMEVDGQPVEIYVLFDNNDASRDLELIIPAAGKIKPLTQKERWTLLEQFNTLNGAYTGAKITLDENRIVIGWSMVIAKTKISSTALMRMVYRFVGTAAVFWKEVEWALQG